MDEGLRYGFDFGTNTDLKNVFFSKITLRSSRRLVVRAYSQSLDDGNLNSYAEVAIFIEVFKIAYDTELQID